MARSAPDSLVTGLPVIGGAPRPAYAAVPEGVRPRDVAALYVHVPFCATKCHYCDFYSLAGHLHEVPQYLEALEREIGLQTGVFGRPAPRTMFIGGGTPTLLSAEDLGRLLGLIRANIDASRLVEFTVEANPNTFTSDRARALAGNGVNRISFGAQSFVPSELATLQRDHDPENVAPAVEIAREAGIANFNIDLIFGIPGQTQATWDFSLQSALALGPEHVSAYSLIYEPNTAMAARLERGDFSPIDEETELAMFNHTYATLRGAGFSRYEVSNHARPGRECRHNLHYWLGDEYLAWGPSAAAHVGGVRWKNVSSLNHYLAALLGEAPVLPLTQMEHLSPLRRAGELAMLSLRLSRGIEYGDFVARTGIDPRPRLVRVCQKYAGMGLLDASETGLALTEAAVPVSNTIVAEVLEAFN